MKHEYLSSEEVRIVREGARQIPHVYRGSIGLDSMGPIRNPNTDEFFPGTQEALGYLSETLRDYDVQLVAATNGPDIEGEDILKSLTLPVTAFAVTEGGGKYIAMDRRGKIRKGVIAHGLDVNKAHELGKWAKEADPVMQVILEDKTSDEDAPSMRTPYDTNVVITLPYDIGVFERRLHQQSIDMHAVFPDINEGNYVSTVLPYINEVYAAGIRELSAQESVSVLTKSQNRRIYVTPRHLVDGHPLNKRSGAERGALILDSTHGMDKTFQYRHHPFELERSMYIADKAVDTTSEGQKILSASERVMMIGERYSGTEPYLRTRTREINVDGRTVFITETSARLAMNVTMNDDLPRMDMVEGVPILHIGSGLKALEAVGVIYEEQGF